MTGKQWRSALAAAIWYREGSDRPGSKRARAGARRVLRTRTYDEVDMLIRSILFLYTALLGISVVVY